MRVVLAVAIAAAASIAVLPSSGQEAKPTSPAKSTQPLKPTKRAKETKATPPVVFEAHNEGSVEGAIYGAENLVNVTIDSAGIRYKAKSADKPSTIPWGQIAGWQANNFTSRSPTRADGGDFGIGIYQGARYLSFRTRNGRDFIAAIKALRALASVKERPGIG